MRNKLSNKKIEFKKKKKNPEKILNGMLHLLSIGNIARESSNLS